MSWELGSTMSDLTRYNKVRPPKKPKEIVMRLSSLNSFARRDLVSNYFLMEKPSILGHVWTNTSYQQRMDSRPPLKADMEGPTPCTYSASIPVPSVHGTKINPKSKYSRDALPNPNTDLWTHNTTVALKHPGPLSYNSHNVIGRHCPVVREAPAFSLTPRRLRSVSDGQRPAPNIYNSIKGMELTLTRHPAFTIATRKNARKLVATPGPAHYHPDHSLTQFNSPAFTMRRRRHSRTGTF